MSAVKDVSIMALQVIASAAAKAAYDLEHGRLWEGDLEKVVEEIQRLLRDVRER